MRILQTALLTSLSIALMTGAGVAATVVFDWQGMGRSEVFTIARKAGSWQAAWECEAHSSATIAILNAESGVPVDFLGASYRGERLVSKTGRFLLDTRGSFCRVTVTTTE
jgi:hypothetical protein